MEVLVDAGRYIIAVMTNIQQRSAVVRTKLVDQVSKEIGLIVIQSLTWFIQN